MATKVIMPKLSPTMEEGQLSRWVKKEGDKVSMGEPLAEIDTDKATMEMQALGNGVLRKILIQEGQSAPLGQLIAIIGEPDEDISTLLSQATTSQQAQSQTAPPASSTDAKPTGDAEASPPAVSEATDKAGGNGRQAPAKVEAASPDRLIVSPLAARMAAESGI